MNKIVKIIIYALIFVIFSSLSVFSNPLVLDENIHKYYVSSHVLYLVDGKNILTIQDILKLQNSKRYLKPKNKFFGLGYKDRTLWVKLTVLNKKNNKKGYCLEVPIPTLDWIDFYSVKNGKIKTVVKTGDHYNFNSRQIKNRKYIFKIEKDNKPITYYLRIRSTSRKTFAPIIWDKEKFIFEDNKESTIIWMFVAIMLVMAIYNALIFILSKDISYLYYILICLTYIMYQLSLQGLAFQYFWPNNTWLANGATVSFVGIMLSAILLFSRRFIGVKDIFPKWDKFIVLFVFYIFICVFIFFFFEKSIFGLIGYLIIYTVIFPFFIWVSLWKAKRGDKKAVYFLASWIFFYLGTAVLLSNNLKIISIGNVGNWASLIGSTLQIIFLSLGLASKINIMKDKVLNINKDLIQSEKKLNEAEIYLNNIIDSISSVIIGIDSNGNVTHWNSTAEKDFGIKEIDAIGRPIEKLLITFNEEMAEIIKSIEEKEFYIIKKIKHINEGNTNYFNITIYPLQSNNLDGTVLRIDDVTEFEKNESQLRQSQKMDTVGTLAGGLAHDLNNVLGGIIGPLSIIENIFRKENYKNETIFEYIDIMNQSSQRAVDMVKQLLALSRKQEFNFVNIVLNSSIKNVIKICENTFDKSIKIEYLDPKKKAIIKGDVSQIEQILLNFFLNASHAMTIMREEGKTWGGILTISIESIFADEFFKKTHPESKEQSYWMISVKDTGVGMDSRIISKIFNPFFTTKEKGKGTGLGLSMVYNTIKQHDGFIDVYSEVNIGSTFNIYLPVPKDKIDSNESVNDNQKVFKGEGLIFVVDDESIIRNTAKGILEEAGYSVILAENGKEAIDIFKKSHDKIKAVLLDMVMPELSGKETYLQMKEIDSDVRVLLASGFKQDKRVNDVLNLGVNDFIQKPYNLFNLSKMMAELIEK